MSTKFGEEKHAGLESKFDKAKNFLTIAGKFHKIYLGKIGMR